MTNDKIPAAVSVDWWFGETDLGGVSEFKSALTNAYTVAVVRDRRGPLGGGLYQLAIEFLSRLSLSDVARILVEGATYDLIKSGTDPFFIRPFIEAYKRFKNRPKNERVDIERLRFVFQDSAITIERLPNTDLVAELRPILEAVAEHFESIIAGSDGQLFEIYIPVFEDTSEERVCKYRTLLSTDETLDMRQSACFSDQQDQSTTNFTRTDSSSSASLSKTANVGLPNVPGLWEYSDRAEKR